VKLDCQYSAKFSHNVRGVGVLAFAVRYRP
jgi:hypothetical protein